MKRMQAPPTKPLSPITNYGRVVAAAVITVVWGLGRFFNLITSATDARIDVCWKLAFSWGRRSSPKPMICIHCGWAGQERHTKHVYYPDGQGDVYPEDECPRCGYSSMRPIGPSCTARLRKEPLQ